MDSDPQWTQSPPEQEFLHLIAIAGLPRPQTNRLIEGHLVDFVWPAQRLIVEVDSYDFHTSRNAFEADRRRDAELQRHGWRVLRITARRLHNDPHRVIADLRALLNL
jgi:very-short-patch-repair endonuclease